MKCPSCGSPIAAGSALCESCGSMPTVQPIPGEAPIAATSVNILGGRFELLEVLGRGGMGTVYRARDLNLGGEEVALKLMRAFNRDPKELERLKREIITARRINHPNVLRVYEFGTLEGDAYLTMEVLVGGSLDSRLDRPLSLFDAMRIAVGVADGLAAAHAQGIIHRDIKTENVMFDGEDRPKLVDFGLARLHSTSATVGFSGTPQYMSPELAQGGEITFRSDVYSLGVLLYRIFTGRLPFDGQTLMKLAMQHANEMPAAPRTLNATLPPELEAVLGTCLQKDPMHRYADAGDVSRALRACISTRQTVHGVPLILPPPPEPAPRPRSRRGIALAAGAGALALLLIAGGVALNAGPEAASTPAPTPIAAVSVTPAATPVTPEPTAESTSKPEATPDPAPTKLAVATRPPQKTPAKTPRGATPAPTAVAMVAAGPGTLTVTSRPWSEVWINGKRAYAETPVLMKSCPSGKHKFRFVNPALNLSVEREFEISPGKTTSIVVDLNKGSAELQSGS